MVKLLFLLSVCPALQALAESSILGIVQDRSNAPITGAKIVVFDVSGKGFQTTSSAGRFALDGIADGEYLFRVESTGNKPVFGALRLKASEPQNISVVTSSATSQRPEAVGAGAALREAVRPPRSSPKRPKVKPAQETKKLTPVYPAAERKAGIRGTVRLAMIILPNGAVDDLVVLSAPNSNFAVPALLAVRQWEYSPTYLDNEPVEASLTVDVNFGL